MADLVDIVFEDARWQEAGLASLAERAGQATLVHLGLLETCEISLLACDDARIAELNADFRDKAKATNVLSWPSEERAADAPGAHPELPKEELAGMPIELGDIAISYDTCVREAKDAGKPMEAHVTHLMVHGVLHLLGYDHIDDQDAATMEELEAKILGKLGLPDPYM